MSKYQKCLEYGKILEYRVVISSGNAKVFSKSQGLEKISEYCKMFKYLAMFCKKNKKVEKSLSIEKS